MAKNPNDRYGSASELAQACGEALEIFMPEGAPTPTPSRSRLPAASDVPPTAVSE
jgi:hypothetical protein